MIFQRVILFSLIIFFCIDACAQYQGNNHIKALVITNDTVRLDSLSLVPGSVRIATMAGAEIDTSFYKIDYVNGLLILNLGKFTGNNIRMDNLMTSYKTFPYLFSEETKHKDVSKIKAATSGNFNPFSYQMEDKSDDIFKMEGLNKSGSIARGIRFGNNQDVVVNSNLNLQLSGHLNNNVDILLVATDNNIPIQPDGNTQQLQEFDKVFVQLSNETNKLIAGDFQLTRPAGYFMNFNKKAQGLSFSTALKTNKIAKDEKEQGLYKTSLNAAVSRGKFARNQIQGIESNQGPYRLRGAENELFIIVLSGTEKVYIDGRLVTRGQENDYIIDYNAGTIMFTAKQLITKDKRIVVEFQYSDKNYARSLVHFGNEYEKDKLKLHLNIYSEQDSKNQPLQQDLSPAQKQMLRQIGDTLSLAVVPSYTLVAPSNSEVLYTKMDIVIGTRLFTIFVYDPINGNYRVSYSNVGAGKGNYNQVTSSANGRVFEWVMPDTITNELKGSYEPIIQLITPKKKQMLTAGLDYQISKNSTLSVEGAMSNNDINTFSSANSGDDAGYALKVNYDNTLPLQKTTDTLIEGLKLLTNVNYEYVQEYFSPIERYRNVEFERDWNRGTNTFGADQHIVGAAVGLIKKGTGAVGYRFNTFFEGSKYNANKHAVNTNFSRKGFDVQYDGSFLNSSGITNTNFYRHKSGISQKMKWFVVGLKDEFEQNKFSLTNKDSLLANSYQFWEWQAYIQNPDTAKNRYGINYKQRTDYGVGNILGITTLSSSAFAESYNGFFELLSKENNQLKINASYRKLQILDPALTSQKADNSLISRIEYSFKLLKGVIFSNSFYEIGAGMEVKKEFSYIEVPAGQGVFTWNDYDNDSIKELNEFEIAAFPDQARYIKVYTPTNEFIKTYSNQFSEVLMIKPAVLWVNKKGFKKFISRFANQTSYRVDRKSTETDLAKAYNPFLTETNDARLITINSSFRNTLFINQLSPVLGVDLTYQDMRNKVLLVNGFDSRKNSYKEGQLRWNITKQFSLNGMYRDGIKSSTSQYFSTRDYLITYYEAEPKINYQPNTSFRTSISFKYTDKKNKAELGGQHAVLQNYGVEVKYNVLQKGSLNFNANFIQIRYNSAQNTPLAFEMLESLTIGKNITWNAGYQRTLSNNLQLNITYEGRKSEGKGAKIVHIGGAQVRAYF